MKKEMDFSELDIPKLIELFKRYRVEELSLEERGLKLDIKRDLPLELRPPAPVVTVTSQPSVEPSANPTETQTVSAAAQEKPAVTDDSDKYEKVMSPMVGTFYRAPSPDAEPFAREGDMVSHDSTVCIIEAMKMMNEIKSEKSGKVIKFLVKNGDPVQPNQPLVIIEPD